MTDRDARVRAFLRWARDHLGRLHGSPSEEAAGEIGAAIEGVDPQLGVEVEEEVHDRRELIVTAFSAPDRFLLVHRLVAGLQGIEGWRVVALKPARGYDFVLELAGRGVQASALRFEPLDDLPGSIRVLVEPSVSLPAAAEDAEELGWLIVETGLGEELAARLAHVELAPMERPGARRPLAELAAHVRGLAGE